MFRKRKGFNSFPLMFLASILFAVVNCKGVDVTPVNFGDINITNQMYTAEQVDQMIGGGSSGDWQFVTNTYTIATNALSRQEAEKGFTEWTVIGRDVRLYVNWNGSFWILNDVDSVDGEYWGETIGVGHDATQITYFSPCFDHNTLGITATRVRLPTMADIPTKTSDLTNDGSDGDHPFISQNEVQHQQLTPVYGGNGERYVWMWSYSGLPDGIIGSPQPSFDTNSETWKANFRIGGNDFSAESSWDEDGGLTNIPMTAFSTAPDEESGQYIEFSYTATRTLTENPIIGYTLGDQTNSVLAATNVIITAETATNIASSVATSLGITTNDVCNIVTNVDVETHWFFTLIAGGEGTDMSLYSIEMEDGIWNVYYATVLVMQIPGTAEFPFRFDDGLNMATIDVDRKNITRNALGLARLTDIAPSVSNTVTKSFIEDLGIESGISAETATNIASSIATSLGLTTNDVCNIVTNESTSYIMESDWIDVEITSLKWDASLCSGLANGQYFDFDIDEGGFFSIRFGDYFIFAMNFETQIGSSPPEWGTINIENITTHDETNGVFIATDTKNDLGLARLADLPPLTNGLISASTATNIVNDLTEGKYISTTGGVVTGNIILPQTQGSGSTTTINGNGITAGFEGFTIDTYASTLELKGSSATINFSDIRLLSGWDSLRDGDGYTVPSLLASATNDLVSTQQMEALDTSYRHFSEPTNVNQSVQFVTNAPDNILTIQIPVGHDSTKDWIVYAFFATNVTISIPTNIVWFSSKASVTNEIPANTMTALYFTQIAEGAYVVSRSTMTPILQGATSTEYARPIESGAKLEYAPSFIAPSLNMPTSNEYNNIGFYYIDIQPPIPPKGEAVSTTTYIITNNHVEAVYEYEATNTVQSSKSFLFDLRHDSVVPEYTFNRKPIRRVRKIFERGF